MTGADKPLPHQLVRQARQIAEAHGLFIVEVEEKGKPAWVVYRKLSGNEKTRLYRRNDPAELLKEVRITAGVAA